MHAWNQDAGDFYNENTMGTELIPRGGFFVWREFVEITQEHGKTENRPLLCQEFFVG